MLWHVYNIIHAWTCFAKLFVSLSDRLICYTSCSRQHRHQPRRRQKCCSTHLGHKVRRGLGRGVFGYLHETNVRRIDTNDSTRCATFQVQVSKGITATKLWCWPAQDVQQTAGFPTTGPFVTLLSILLIRNEVPARWTLICFRGCVSERFWYDRCAFHPHCV